MIDDGYPVAGYEVAITGMTDRGLVRPSNEDSLIALQDLAPPSKYLAVAGVFDGVGGQAHGDRASSVAAKCLAQLVSDSSLSLVSAGPPEVILEEIMHQLHNTKSS